MDHIYVTSLQFMSHGHTKARFGMSKFNIGSPISFNMDMRGHSGTLSTPVGTKSFMSKEELTIRPMKNSQLVGGFVGSKSQLGTSNRISCQIWDIVLSKLMSFMNSSSIRSASSLESSEYSYAFVQDLATDMLDSMYRDISESNAHPAGDCAMTTDTRMCNELTPMNSEKLNLLAVSGMESNPISVLQQEPLNVKHMESCKQSYADVTKAARHTDVMKGNVKHDNILCSKNNVKKVQTIPVREKNNASKRKKQNCRRKKAYIPDCNSIKPQSNCKKKGSKFNKNDQWKASNFKVQNTTKKQKNITVSNVKNDASTKAGCNDTNINFTSNFVNENNSLVFKKKQESCMSLLGKSKKREFQKQYTNPHMKRVSVDTSQNCVKKDREFESKKEIAEDEFLTKKPSFSCVHENGTHKANRFHSDSSDSDDFVIFAIDETDTVQTESDSEEDSGDCFSDCDTEEIWNSKESDSGFSNCDAEEIWDIQAKYTDEADQATEDLRKINEKWQKMYSCFPGRPKEPKKVKFASNEKLKTVHSIIAWDFAYRAARIGPWQQIALDQDRFMQRILKLEQIISPVLTREHRLYVCQRTMKYLNAVNSED